MCTPKYNENVEEVIVGKSNTYERKHKNRLARKNEKNKNEKVDW